MNYHQYAKRIGVAHVNSPPAELAVRVLLARARHRVRVRGRAGITGPR